MGLVPTPTAPGMLYLPPRLRLNREYDLFGIKVIDEEIKFVKEIGEKLRSEAMKVLERGVEGLNQAEVGIGLQVFYNMGELKLTVDQLVNKYKGMAVKRIRSSGAPHIGGGGKVREALWQRMGSCMDQGEDDLKKSLIDELSSF
ncbi:hypothetical protein YC2023_040493 [Brassica napus]